MAIFICPRCRAVFRTTAPQVCDCGTMTVYLTEEGTWDQMAGADRRNLIGSVRVESSQVPPQNSMPDNAEEEEIKRHAFYNEVPLKKIVMLSTTEVFQGKTIVRYLGVVMGDTYNFFMGDRYGFGQLSTSIWMKKGIEGLKNAALNKMQEKAAAMGANAIVGVKVEISQFQDADAVIMGHRQERSFLLCNVTGTAVIVQ